MTRESKRIPPGARVHNANNYGKIPKDRSKLAANANFFDLAHLCTYYRMEHYYDFTGTQRKLAKVRGSDSVGRLFLQAPRVHGAKKGTRIVPTGHYDYVVSPKGSLYLNVGAAGWTHANILSGRPVQSAGKAQVVRGCIVMLDNKSGHYRPSTSQMLLCASGLVRRGWLLPTCVLSLPYDGPTSFPVSQLASHQLPLVPSPGGNNLAVSEGFVRPPKRHSLFMRVWSQVRHKLSHCKLRQQWRRPPRTDPLLSGA